MEFLISKYEEEFSEKINNDETGVRAREYLNQLSVNMDPEELNSLARRILTDKKKLPNLKYLNLLDKLLRK